MSVEEKSSRIFRVSCMMMRLCDSVCLEVVILCVLEVIFGSRLMCELCSVGRSLKSSVVSIVV